jgi:F-type H+-transporting ATPase subunit alpha
VEKEVIAVWLGTTGQLDEVPLEDVRRFESEFLDFISHSYSGVLDTIRETGELTDDALTTLKDAITEFKKSFQASTGELLIEDEPPAEALDEGDVEQEKISRVKKS